MNEETANQSIRPLSDLSKVEEQSSNSKYIAGVSLADNLLGLVIENPRTVVDQFGTVDPKLEPCHDTGTGLEARSSSDPLSSFTNIFKDEYIEDTVIKEEKPGEKTC